MNMCIDEYGIKSIGNDNTSIVYISCHAAGRNIKVGFNEQTETWDNFRLQIFGGP
jgi:hypothetical protein